MGVRACVRVCVRSRVRACVRSNAWCIVQELMVERLARLCSPTWFMLTLVGNIVGVSLHVHSLMRKLTTPADMLAVSSELFSTHDP